MPTNLEIEKKYIIAYPDVEYLKSIDDCTYTNIEQIYLLSEDPSCSERIRKRGMNGDYKYYHTIKRHVSELVREETENLITEEEYKEFKKRANPNLSIIRKTRYVIPYKGHVMEIDVFPFWNRQAYLEVELESSHVIPEIPEYIKCICEVSGDKKYSNHALAYKIPEQII